ncbi:MAG: DUF3570 domain-containing protein [Polyangiaceae bacterium]|nr:DUF3570 domain-containing protein [Polyangiaceae bacterium]
MRAATELAALLGFLALVIPAAARADEAEDARKSAAEADKKLREALEADEDRGWAFEEMRFFTAFVWQQGHGLQSQAGPIRGRGREDAWVLQPWMYVRVRQNEEVTHELTVPVDIVSAASTDAIDAVSKASEYNEAVTTDLTTTYSPNDTVDMGFRFAAHYEEPMRSLIGGPFIDWKLFEENTVFGINATVVSDGFDPHSYTGRDRGFAARTSFSFNLSYLQVLSPTTLLDASFGTTQQWGVLETTWNSVIATRAPTPDDPKTVYRTGERFPKSRNRDALFVRLSQHIPVSHTTAKASYRFYVDENGTFAHTTEAQIFQYLVPWMYVRVHGRLHTQNAPDFWLPFVEEPFSENLQRSSDSDLEDLTAREAGIKLVFVRDQAPAAFRGPDTFDVQYFRYERSNDLHIDSFSMGYARSF